MLEIFKNFLLLSIAFSMPVFADNPVLKREAGKILKIDRVNSDVELKNWSDKNRASVEEALKVLQGSDLAPVLQASTQAALNNLENEEFSGALEDLLSQVKYKSWDLVLKDLLAKLREKNLCLQDLANKPEIIEVFVATLEVKEKSFWAQRATYSTDKAKPITEPQPEYLVPAGALAEGLKLARALSKHLKIEVNQNPNNLLLRYFISK